MDLLTLERYIHQHIQKLILLMLSQLIQELIHMLSLLIQELMYMLSQLIQELIRILIHMFNQHIIVVTLMVVALQPLEEELYYSAAACPSYCPLFVCV